jgi:hypothetical protein
MITLIGTDIGASMRRIWTFYDTGVFDYFRDLLPKDFKVLDIGCGFCKFYPVFKALGCSLKMGG